MIIHNWEQYSDEWWTGSAGIPTASELSRIFTPAKLELSTQSKAYQYELVAARDIGRRDDSGFKSYWMEHGSNTEEEARDYLSLIYDKDIRQVGFITTDDGSFGASPDGLLENAGIEIKCPKPSTLVKWVMEGGLPREYRLQVIGTLMITDYDYWDFVGYVRGMDPLIVRTNRKDVQKEIAIIKDGLKQFNSDLDALEKKYKDSRSKSA